MAQKTLRDIVEEDDKLRFFNLIKHNKYDKTTWVSNETLISAERLNHIEDGIAAADAAATENAVDIAVIDGDVQKIAQNAYVFCPPNMFISGGPETLQSVVDETV